MTIDIEWVNVIVTAACTILGLLFGAGGVGIVYHRQTKRTKDAEASKAESDADKAKVATQHQYVLEWKELYEKKEARVNVLEAKLDEMRNSRDEYKQQYMDEKFINQRLEYDKCTVNGCKDRQPPHLFDAKGNDVAVSCEHCNK